MEKKYDIAAYIWPAYTGNDPRARTFWEEGIGEWQTVKNAVSKFRGHDWPRRPLWGYVNEADPYVMEMEIAAATDHGVNVFIYDWYWYDNRPFLENCLNDGFLKAKNCNKMKFYLMWANHSVNNTWDIRNSHREDNMIWDGAVNRAQFEDIARRLIDRYFKHPSYYTIEGKPVFMIYDLENLVRGLGGIEQTKDAFEWFRQSATDSGLSGLHLQLTVWGEKRLNLSGVDTSPTGLTTSQAARRLGFDSTTHYQFVHFVNIDRDYQEISADVLKEWKRMEALYEIPYFPHVSVGWDNNPRFRDLREGIVRNNTPQNVRRMLEHAKRYVIEHPGQAPLVTINSWNEWTESSYLEPDDLYGYGYLEAVKATFLSDGP